ncbi:MAG TPA: hypothetical protein VLY24_23010 [Bryobacteraceae bacterium]|nr:hypothetical protein [Bryobacteraceae bacterium]
MTLKQSVDQHDREIAAIRKLLLTGTKMLNQVIVVQKRSEARLERLETGVARLEASVQQPVDSLRRGGNGHTKRKVDLQ